MRDHQLGMRDDAPAERARTCDGPLQGTGRDSRRALPAAGALIAIVVMLMAAAVPAGAVIVRVQGHAISYQRLSSESAVGALTQGAEPSGPKGGKPNSKSPLIYHEGGRVMPANTNFAVYWDPAGAPEYPGGYEAGINRYFEALAHDSGGLQNTDSILTQYFGPPGQFAEYDSHFGGALIDTDPYPASGCSSAPTCLTDAQIRSEVRAYVEARALPIDLEHEYFLLTPPGVESCTEASGKSCSAGTSHPLYCAYHSFIETPGSALLYADDPYVEGLGCDVGEEHPNGNASDATIAGGLAHEHSETVTDPELNAWFDSKGEEVADKCRTLKAKSEYGEPLGQTAEGTNYNEVIDGSRYLYQRMWSNSADGCAQRAQQLPTVTKVAPKSGAAAGGTAVTITGTGFVSPASVHFGATPGTEVVVHSSSSITVVSPPGTPKSIVDLTVSTSAGTSAVTSKAHFKYKTH